MQQEKSCSLVALPKCLGENMVELDTFREMATVPQVPFRELHKIGGVTEEDFLSHECHATRTEFKDALKPLLLEFLNTRELIIRLM